MSEALPAPRRPVVAVAGATGFVGSKLVRALTEGADVVALGRRVPAGSDGEIVPGGVAWRRCDLFSLRDTEDALRDVEVAYYLVHSMLPTARLTQGRFEDLDLLLADNFARAAKSAGVRRIIYLGGLVDTKPDAELSRHLASRLEAEEALGAYGIPVTPVRASLIVGPGGSSLEIMVRLVQRLPVMLCPQWTTTRSQPIALQDVVAALVHCLTDDETTGRVCEVGGPDVLTYREMMAETGRVLGKRRWLFRVPFFTPGLSRLWVSLITRKPRALVAPLIQSLRHPMVVTDRFLMERLKLEAQPFREALADAVRIEGLRRDPVARSVQRLPLPPGRDADWVSKEYARWLPRLLRPFLRVSFDGDLCRIGARGFERPLLDLTRRPDRSAPDRALFAITGGLLAGRRDGHPRLEFRITPDGHHVLAAVQDFHPAMPWRLYALTQAQLHRFVMWRFAKHLEKLSRC